MRRKLWKRRRRRVTGIVLPVLYRHGTGRVAARVTTHYHSGKRGNPLGGPKKSLGFNRYSLYKMSESVDGVGRGRAECCTTMPNE